MIELLTVSVLNILEPTPGFKMICLLIVFACREILFLFIPSCIVVIVTGIMSRLPVIEDLLFSLVFPANTSWIGLVGILVLIFLIEDNN